MKSTLSLPIKSALLITIVLLSGFLLGPLQAAQVAKNPKMIVLDSLKDKYGAVHFDHAKHTGLAGDCGTCHHQHGANSALPCKECHALSPEQFRKSVIKNFSACRDCHGTPDRSNPGMPGLQVAYHVKCFQCHRGMADIGTDPKACAEMCHAKAEKSTSSRTGN